MLSRLILARTICWRQFGTDILIAGVSCYLFDEIFLDGKVVPPGRRNIGLRTLRILALDPESLEDTYSLVGKHIEACEAFYRIRDVYRLYLVLNHRLRI